MVFPALIVISRIRRALRRGAVIIDISGAPGDILDAIAIPENLIPLNVERLRQLRKPLVICGHSVLRNFNTVQFLRKKGLDVYNGGNRRLVARAKQAVRL